MSASSVNVSILCTYIWRTVGVWYVLCGVCEYARLRTSAFVAKSRAHTQTFLSLDLFSRACVVPCARKRHRRTLRWAFVLCILCVYVFVTTTTTRRQWSFLAAQAGGIAHSFFFLRRTKVCVQRSALCYTTLVTSKSSELRSISINWIR